MLAPGIGYLRIKSFDEPTGKLVKSSIEKLGGAASQGAGDRFARQSRRRGAGGGGSGFAVS